MRQIHKYSEEERLSILRDYYSSGMSLSAYVRQNGLCGTSLLIKWERMYGSRKDFLPLQSESSNDDEMANRSKDYYKEENSQLKKRIRELEKALEFSRLETLARDKMIDKAEEYFDISIRKKSGAK